MRKWFVYQNGNRLGPYDGSQLRRLVSDGKLQPNDFVGKEGTTLQKRAKDIKGLFDEVSEDEIKQEDETLAFDSNLSLVSFVWRYWEATQVSFLYPFLSALLLIPALSLLKPKLGYQGLFDIAEIVSLVAVGMVMFYQVKILGSFYLGGRRKASEIAPGFIGILGSYLFILGLLFLVPLAMLEKFMPPSGFLVRILPYTKTIQKDLDIDIGEILIDDEVKIAENDPRLKLTSLSAKKSGFRAFTLLSSAMKKVNIQDYVIKDGEIAEVVVSEGTGKSQEEALKESFRNAISQVVGTLVDSELIIQNDKVIEEKILTYSNGFIKTYEVISNSDDEEKGIYRLKIKAEVRKQNVIAELKSSNISTNEIDGEGLASEIVTKIEAKKKALDLFENQFKDVPDKLIKATSIGQPREIESSETQAKIEILIKVESNLQAYNEYSSKLVSVLTPMANSTGNFSISFDLMNQKDKGGNKPGIEKVWSLDMEKFRNKMPEWIREAFDKDRRFKPNGSTFLVLATNRTPDGDRIDYKYFELPSNYKSVVQRIMSKSGQVKINLVDKQNNIVGSDTKPIGEFMEVQSKYSAIVSMSDFESIFWISPTFFESNSPESMTTFRHKPGFYISQKFNLNLEELKSLDHTKIEILYYD